MRYRVRAVWLCGLYGCPPRACSEDAAPQAPHYVCLNAQSRLLSRGMRLLRLKMTLPWCCRPRTKHRELTSTYSSVPLLQTYEQVCHTGN